MNIQDKIDMRILAEARRGLDLRTNESYGDAAERARRVEAYSRQIEQTGRITAWMQRLHKRGIRRRLPVRLPQWRGFAY